MGGQAEKLPRRFNDGLSDGSVLLKDTKRLCSLSFNGL